MDIRATDQQYNPYRIFTREQWAGLRCLCALHAGDGFLPRQLTYRGRPVNPAAVNRMGAAQWSQRAGAAQTVRDGSAVLQQDAEHEGKNA